MPYKTPFTKGENADSDSVIISLDMLYLNLDGPAPRSLDRFALSFSGRENVMADTGAINNTVPRPV